ncbi:MAG: ZIP family metal transporter [Bacilli bacterium]|nr:ZIP family metal transporter [Bacilli bacterium]
MSFLYNLNPIIQAILATIFTWSVTAIGAALVFMFKKVNKNVLDSMLGISAGVMIAASFWSLLSPSINMAKSLNMNIILVVSLGFLSGGLLLFIGDKVTSKLQNKGGLSTSKRVLMLITSITLHNIPEGLAVGVAFGSTLYGLDGASIISAWTLAIGIGIQNFPEGTAVSVPLRREGFSRRKAFFYGQLSGIVEPIAGVIGAILVLKIRLILPFLLAFAAGAMIYVVVEELIPESQTNESKDLMSMFTLVGFVIMMLLDVLLE